MGTVGVCVLGGLILWYLNWQSRPKPISPAGRYYFVTGTCETMLGGEILP